MTTPHTVLLIDDEAPARSLLRQYLASYPQFEIVAEAADGKEALAAIRAYRPAIVFMDVQMPGLTGLEVLARLDELPLVIFSTAYDRYALEAFEFHAVDYLLKPYARDRFERAVNQLLPRLAQPQDSVAELAQQLRDQARPASFPDRIMVPRGSKYIALPAADILHIRAEGDYSSLVTADAAYLSSYGLKKLEKRLDPERFLRVHRSAIVQRTAIKEVYREGHGFDLVMSNGDIVRAGRAYAERVRELLF